MISPVAITRRKSSQIETILHLCKHHNRLSASTNTIYQILYKMSQRKGYRKSRELIQLLYLNNSLRHANCSKRSTPHDISKEHLHTSSHRNRSLYPSELLPQRFSIGINYHFIAPHSNPMVNTIISKADVLYPRGLLSTNVGMHEWHRSIE